jgi:hypothetical protein
MQPSLIENLIAEYRSAALLHSQPGDGTAASLTRCNKAADRMVVISREIAAGGREAVAVFADLLTSSDPHLSIWAAHHLLDFMHPDDGARIQALSLIERNAQGSSPQAVGDQVWLENWSAEQQDE